MVDMLFFKLRVMWFFRRKCFQIVEFSDTDKKVLVKDVIRDENFMVEQKGNVWRILYNLKDRTYPISTIWEQSLHNLLRQYKYELTFNDVRKHCENILGLLGGQITEYLVDNQSCYDTLFAQYEKQYTHL